LNLISLHRLLKKWSFNFLIILNGQYYFAQLDNSALFFNTHIDTTTEYTPYVKIQNLNYLKNNEYSGGIADGYTLFGYQFNPQVGYRFNKYISLEAGIFLNKDFGNKKFTIIEPSFSFRYIKNNFKMLFGSLDGSVNHQLIEPIYNFERIFTNRLENGAQFVLNKKYFDFDIWIDWLSMTYKYSGNQEQLLFGLNANVLKLKKDKWEFKIPLQLTMMHLGGQLDTLNKGTTTNTNFVPGLILNYQLENKYVKSIFTDVRFAQRINNYFDTVSTTSSGMGLMANLGLKAIFDTDLLISYWYCDNFYTDFGGFLYSSKSSTVAYYPWYSERIRELLFIRLSKKFKLDKGINLLLRAEPYYDMRSKWWEYSFGFYISIDEQIWLKRR